jgi:hypothetical protein
MKKWDFLLKTFVVLAVAITITAIPKKFSETKCYMSNIEKEKEDINDYDFLLVNKFIMIKFY